MDERHLLFVCIYKSGQCIFKPTLYQLNIVVHLRHITILAEYPFLKSVSPSLGQSFKNYQIRIPYPL